MKTKAGDYRWRYQWLACTRTADGLTGDKPRSYTSNGYLWGSAELTEATNETDYGAIRTVVSGQARFRGNPAISTLDRLVLLRDNITFVIDGVRRNWDQNELIVDIHSLPLS